MDTPSSKNLPRIAQKAPFPVEVEANKKYFWCTCGLSDIQPFCDGQHKGSGLKSLCFEDTKNETIYLCGCKQTKNPPFCDGSHSSL